MTNRQQKLIENYVRLKVRKMLKENNDVITPRDIYYRIGDAVQDIAYLANNETKLKKEYALMKKALDNFRKSLDLIYNKKWD